jgi:hypothetical protein
VDRQRIEHRHDHGEEQKSASRLQQAAVGDHGK